MKSKINLFYKNNKYILFSGLSALFIILIVYFCYSIIPFGDKIIYRMDLYHQYGPLFSELYDRITSGESLLYSWNSGLGSSFIGNFFNYLSSPISFIILLFGHENTFEAVAAMIAIKAVLSSISITYYLKKSQKSDGPQLIAFGITYAFSAYFIAYYWNVMWIDSMYLLPLIALGIEKIINHGKCANYIFFLSLAIYTNYYIGFMLCIFSCLYFVYYYLCSFNTIKEKQILLNKNSDKPNLLDNSFFLNSGIKFALSSVSVGLILLFMLVPVAYVLKSSSATSGTAPTELKFYYDIFDFLANHLASLEPTIRSSGEDVLPNIYCGILTIILVPLYIFSNKIRSIEKIATVALLSIFYISFNVNFINYLWHGLHFPNDLPYRQSFMYSFILIIIAYKAFKNIDGFSKNQLITIGTGIIIFIILIQKIGSKNVTDTTIFISIAFVVAYIIILGIIKSQKNQAVALSFIFSCLVISESIIASTQHYVANQNKPSFTEDYDDFKEIQNVIENNDQELFYRSELSDLRTRMDPCWYNYNGVSVFSSMAYENVANMQKALGLYGNKINSYTYNPQTPVYNSMFSIKYIYDRNNLISDGSYYDLTNANSTYSVYENKYNLNICYPVSDNILEWDTSACSNPVDAQEIYFKLATGLDGLYNRIKDYEFEYNNIYELDDNDKLFENFALYKVNDTEDSSLIINLTASSNDHIYVYINSRNLDDVTISSATIDTTMHVTDGYILDLGYYNTYDSIHIELPLKDEVTYANVDFVLFTMNDEVFIEGYNKLKSGQIEYTEFTDTKIEGSFIAENNEILYTSIPYDEGWNVYIDGKKANNENLIKISDALLGIRVSEGEHTISLEYSIPYMKLATVVSLIFIIFLLFICFIKNKKILIFKSVKQNIWEKSENIVEEIFVMNNEKSENINEPVIETDTTDNQENITE